MIATKLSIQGTHTELRQLIALNQQVQYIKSGQARYFHRLAPGQHLSLFQSRGMDFSEVRAYHPGDAPSSIDWRVTARTGKAHTKIFQEEKQRSTFICLDQTHSMYFGSRRCFKSVYAAYLAAALAWIFYHHDDRTGGLIFNDRECVQLKSRPGKKNVLSLIHAIHQINQKANQQHQTVNQFNSMLKQLSQLIKAHHLLYILSDFSQFDEESLKYLQTLARHNQVCLFMINDQLETQLPQNAALYFSDGEEKMYIQSTKKICESYRELWIKWQTYISQQAKKLGIQLIHLTQQDDLLAALNS